MSRLAFLTVEEILLFFAQKQVQGRGENGEALSLEDDFISFSYYQPSQGLFTFTRENGSWQSERFILAELENFLKKAWKGKISDHSELCQVNDIFFAVPGKSFDPHQHLQKILLEKRPSILVVQKGQPQVDVLRLTLKQKALQVKEAFVLLEVRDTSAWLAQFCLKAYQNDTPTCTYVGITGTDGKTTCSRMLSHLLLYVRDHLIEKKALREFLSHAGLKEGRKSPLAYFAHVASIGTIGEVFDEKYGRHASYTTPPALSLHKQIQTLRNKGAEIISLEASSQALAQGRVSALPWRLALFTNLKEDHLDVHGTHEAYVLAKKKLFSSLSTEAFAGMNALDPCTPKLLENCQGRKAFYRLDADIEDLEEAKKKIASSFDLLQGTFLQAYARKKEKGLQNFKILYWKKTDEKEAYTSPFYLLFSSTMQLAMEGKYNIENALAVLLAVFDLVHIEAFPSLDLIEDFLDLCKGAFRTMKAIPGRMQWIHCGQSQDVLVDFAHTEAGIEALLKHLKEERKEGSQLWITCNAAGDREKEKRKKIAQVCASYADKLLLTLEDMGKENPVDILLDLLEGLGEEQSLYFSPSRPKVIQKALRTMGKNDTLVCLSLGDQPSISVGKEQLGYCEVAYLEQAIAEYLLEIYLEKYFSLPEKEAIAKARPHPTSYSLRESLYEAQVWKVKDLRRALEQLKKST